MSPYSIFPFLSGLIQGILRFIIFICRQEKLPFLYGFCLQFCLHFCSLTLCEKCHYSELSWSVFSRTRTKYGEIRNIWYGLPRSFLRSVMLRFCWLQSFPFAKIENYNSCILGESTSSSTCCKLSLCGIPTFFCARQVFIGKIFFTFYFKKCSDLGII